MLESSYCLCKLKIGVGSPTLFGVERLLLEKEVGCWLLDAAEVASFGEVLLLEAV